MNLPFLVLNEIFSHLSVKDRLNCRLVCRSWRSTLINYEKQKPISSTLFLHNQAFPINKKCAFTNELIGYSNSFESKEIDFIAHEMTKNYFRNLKKMIIFKLLDTNSKADFKNHSFGECISFFKHLEHLELSGLILREEKLGFNLKKLKTLSLKDMYMDYQLVLDTPCLKNLICWIDIDKLKFNYSNHSDCLEYLEYKNQKDNFKFKVKFENLKCLNYYDTNRTNVDNFLCNFPNLKKLIFFSSNAQSRLEQFNRQKLNLGLNDLKIYPFGFEDCLVKHVESIDTFCCYMLYEFYLRSVVENYEKLTNKVSWPMFIDYTSLVNEFTKKFKSKTIPDCFYKKFIDFNIVFVGREIEDHDQLIEFLKRSGYIYKLILQNSQLQQDFYEKLHLCSYIDKLKIVEQSSPMCKKFTDYITDFGFLSKLTINELHFQFYYLNIELIINAFKNKYLRVLHYRKDNLKITIYYHADNDTQVVLDINESFFDLASIDDAIDKLKNHPQTKHLVI